MFFSVVVAVVGVVVVVVVNVIVLASRGVGFEESVKPAAWLKFSSSLLFFSFFTYGCRGFLFSTDDLGVRRRRKTLRLLCVFHCATARSCAGVIARVEKRRDPL